MTFKNQSVPCTNGHFVCRLISKFLELALDRNRAQFQEIAQKSLRAQFLSSTIQELSEEHTNKINELNAKLLRHDVESQSLSHKLQQASQEMQDSHLAFKLMETKLKEEREKHEA
jgi:hypothetical protein